MRYCNVVNLPYIFVPDPVNSGDSLETCYDITENHKIVVRGRISQPGE